LTPARGAAPGASDGVGPSTVRGGGTPDTPPANGIPADSDFKRQTLEIVSTFQHLCLQLEENSHRGWFIKTNESVVFQITLNAISMEGSCLHLTALKLGISEASALP